MSETQKFEYNAPTYVDFVNGFDDSDSVDKFFDLSNKQDTEGDNLNATVTMNSELLVPKIEEEFCTPDKHSTPEPPQHKSLDPTNDCLDQENLTPNVKASLKTPNPQNGRRSRILFEALEGLCITGSLKTHKMMTRKDPRTPLLELRGRTVPRNVNFAFDYSNIQKKSCREILFEDETDHITHQISNLSVSNAAPSQETKNAENDFMPLDNNNTDRTNDNPKASESMAIDNESSNLNETVTIESKSGEPNAQVPIKDRNPFINKSPLRCIDNDMGEHKKRKSTIVDSPTSTTMHNRKYISLANSALKCHANGKTLLENKCGPKDSTRFLTQAKTPNLQTKTRVRPSNVLSHSQEEEKIMAELRSHQPKALPIPKGLFKPPKLGVRKLAVPKYNFSNNVVPRPTSENQQVPKIPRKTVNFTKHNCVKVIETGPDGMTIVNKEVGHKGVKVIEPETKSRPRVTKPQPFSFYEKERERFRQKEERIKKIIEDEKKLAEFKANPLPGFVRKERKHWSSSQGSLNMTTCSHSTTCSVNPDHFVFKAKAPAVLHQKPFVPRKSMKPSSQVLDFTLHTEVRSQQRDVYENSKKQRELEIQLYLQEQERLQREREEAEYRLSRKSTVHKPLPIPKY